MITKLNDSSFSEFILNSDKRVVVDFYADWCGPCKMMSPVFEEVSERNSNIDFCKVNVDESTMIAQRYGIMSIPTFMIFENGQPVKKQLGAMNGYEFENFIK